MINKVAFTPAMSIAEAPEKEVSFKGLPKEEAKEDNSALIYGSLAALGAFGLGMLVRKPKAVEKTVERTVEKTVEKATKAADEVAKDIPNKIPNKSPKGKAHRRKNLNFENREKHMDREDAKWQRKRKKQFLERQMQREADAQFTEQELQTYMKENGYQAPNAEQKRDLANLQSKNKAERAEKNALGNQVPNQEKIDLQKIKAISEIEEVVAKNLKDGGHMHANGNIYFTKGGKVTQIMVKSDGRVITDEKKIAKHLAKNEICVVDLFSEKEASELLAQKEIREFLSNAA